MADWGLKVSENGQSIDNTDDKMVFTSKLFTNKIFMTGVVNIICDTYDSSTNKYYGSATITHNLGYKPIFQCFGDIDDKRVRQGFYDSTSGYVTFRCYVTSTILSIEMWQSSSSTKTARYYIFYDYGD